jgi:hypothetical protein
MMTINNVLSLFSIMTCETHIEYVGEVTPIFSVCYEVVRDIDTPNLMIMMPLS